MEPSRPRFVVCPHCQTENLPGRGECFRCGKSLPLTTGPEDPWKPPASADELPPGGFHIGALMLVIALIAVCLGMTVEAPGLGVVLVLISIPATIRTAVADRRRRRQGRPMTWREYLVVLAASAGVVTAIGVGSVIAFMATCLPVGFLSVGALGGGGIILAFVVGLGTAGFVAFHLIRRLWPRKE